MNQSTNNRLSRIEEALAANTEPKPLADILDAFLQGEYGPPADLFRMLLAGQKEILLSLVDEGRCYPPEMIDHLLTPDKQPMTEVVNEDV